MNDDVLTKELGLIRCSMGRCCNAAKVFELIRQVQAKDDELKEFKRKVQGTSNTMIKWLEAENRKLRELQQALDLVHKGLEAAKAGKTTKIDLDEGSWIDDIEDDE
jgi:hypothetical protein